MARIPVLVSAFVLLGAASAFAQAAPTPPPPPPGGPEPGMQRPPMGGPDGWMGMHHHHMMDKAAAFRFKKDGAEISIRCASTEPTKACVDAASQLIDKVSSVSK